MSRVGKMPIKLADKVKAVVANGQVAFEGPKGKLAVKIPHGDITLAVKDGVLTVSRPSESRQHRALHGLTRAIMANAAHGVAVGWEKDLAIRGVGYRAEVKGKQIHFSLGYSHPVVFDLPEGVTAEVGKTPRTEDTLPTVDLKLKSVNRELVGLTAVKIRALRPPEPYKGKGIKLHTEVVRRKEGKTGTA
ncbi:MAG: 50S ribosomal protein L6 [Myxococcaceae bacterium]|nr:50S ribosomal protein L6 [Myxococcaceae bacterium]